MYSHCIECIRRQAIFYQFTYFMKLYSNFDVADLIAVLVVVAFLILSFFAKEENISPAFLIVIGYYFGHRAANKRNNESTTG